MTVHAPGVPHPRIAQRRADVVATAHSHDRRRRRLLWAGLAVCLALLCGYLATRSELLDVDRVTVSGASRTSAAAVLHAGGLQPGEPLLGLDLASARARIARLPWVGTVYSSRSWNGSVTFEISERIPVAAVATPGGWAIVGAAGRVLAVEPAPMASTVPVLGLNVAAAAPGAWLDHTQRGAVGVAAALTEPVRSAVRAVEVTSEGYVLDLHIPGKVLLGHGTDLAAKLVTVRTFLEKVNLVCLETLDVRAAFSPVLTRGAPCR